MRFLDFLLTVLAACALASGCDREPVQPPPETGDGTLSEPSIDGSQGGPDVMSQIDHLASDIVPYGIACGTTFCTPGPDFCCVTISPPSQHCYPRNVVGPKCDFGAVCDGPEDCGAGGICCMPSGAVNQTYCHSGSCPAGRTLCHRMIDCYPEKMCYPSNEFGWSHSTCVPRASFP